MAAKYAGYRLAQWLSLSLPGEAAFRCAERLADAWRRISAVDRAAVQGNLSMVLDRPVAAGDPLVREVFRNFGRYLVEFFNSHRADRVHVQIQGGEHLDDARRRRRGVIALTGHMGNWELAAVLLRRMGWPVSVIALPHEDPRMDRLFNRQRERSGVEVIPFGPEAARRSLQRLRAGHCLGLLGDRDFARNGAVVSVCGRRMVLPRGPAVLSLRSRAPVVPTFVLREGPWAFRLCIEPPIEPPPRPFTPPHGGAGFNEAAVQAITERYAAVLERYLKQCATQWLLFQPALAEPKR